MTPIERILGALKDRGNNPTRNGKKWSARCPAHEDRRPSLSISEGDDGRALVYCHAGCTADAICAEIGLRVSDLMPMSNGLPASRANGKAQQKRSAKYYSTAREAVEVLERQLGKRSADWTYHDAQGKSVGLIVRWDKSDGTKEIRPVSQHADGWRIKGMPEPRPLYRLPDLAVADRVFVLEGEKASEAARSIGLVATTSSHGSKSAGKTDWSPLAGKDCVILPDHDEAGLAYTDEVVAFMLQITPTLKVRIVELEKLLGGSPMPKGSDLVDWIDGHGDVAEPETIAENLKTLVDAAEVIEAVPPAPSIKRFKPFPTGALPEPIREFVVAGAKAIGCDPSYVALPLLCCLARAIGNKRVIRLKRTWTEPAVIWGAIVGKSGTHKTPAMQIAMQSLTRRQAEAIAEHGEAMASYDLAKAEYDRDYAAWKRSKKTEEQPPWPPEEPV